MEDLKVTFSQALNYMKAGGKVYNLSWYEDFSGREDHPLPIRWIEIQFPDKHSKMTRPYFVFCEDEHLKIPYTIKSSEILSDEWRYEQYNNSTN